MKIIELNTYIVHCYRTNWVFVSVETDEGIRGVGEATLEMKEKAVEAAVLELRDYLIGKDPCEIERHFHVMYRDSYWRTGPVLMSALSAVEMALWDISARALDVPVYRLFGGKCNDGVKAYANAWFAGAKTPEAFAEKAKIAADRGFAALKWDPFGSAYLTMSAKAIDESMAVVGAVRQAVGNSIDLLIEGHGRFNVPTACTLARELEPFNPLFFEEPVPPDNLDALADVRSKSRIPIAAGERLYHRTQFRELFEKRAADVVQPDISHAGGLSECRKIAAMAEAYHIPFAPHNPSGPIANAATLQLAACTPNFFLLETMYSDIPWRKDLTTESLVFKDGLFEIPDGPGLGVELNVEAFADHPYEARPLRHYRGDLTDIRPVGAEPYF
ncbi:galactonate dehydratase [Planctomycetales bacterium ZRK34]|nr:galactonate dehydratase [Planctomycetales bacterium ZRK34]